MVQHLLFADIVPILLICAFTRTLLRPVTRRVQRIEQAVGPLAHPVFGVVAYVGAMWIWHIPPLYDAALEHTLLHVLEHLTFAAAGFLYWWHLLSPIRSRFRLGGTGPIMYMAVDEDPRRRRRHRAGVLARHVVRCLRLQRRAVGAGPARRPARRRGPDGAGAVDRDGDRAGVAVRSHAPPRPIARTSARSGTRRRSSAPAPRINRPGPRSARWFRGRINRPGPRSVASEPRSFGAGLQHFCCNPRCHAPADGHHDTCGLST